MCEPCRGDNVRERAYDLVRVHFKRSLDGPVRALTMSCTFSVGGGGGEIVSNVRKDGEKCE